MGKKLGGYAMINVNSKTRKLRSLDEERRFAGKAENSREFTKIFLFKNLLDQ